MLVWGKFGDVGVWVVVVVVVRDSVCGGGCGVLFFDCVGGVGGVCMVVVCVGGVVCGGFTKSAGWVLHV